MSDHAYDGYKALCQRKLLQIQSLELPLARSYPPNLLEWRSNRKRVNMALPLHFADGESITAEVDSWSTGEDLAGYAVRNRGNLVLSVLHSVLISLIRVSKLANKIFQVFKTGVVGRLFYQQKKVRLKRPWVVIT